jgi:hypothetical protein
LTGCRSIGDHRRTEREHASAVDHRSFRAQLAFSIGFAVARSRALLRRLLKEHAPDDARQQLAERVLEHLELSGFEIDEAASMASNVGIAMREPKSAAVQLPSAHLLGIALRRPIAKRTAACSTSKGC